GLRRKPHIAGGNSSASAPYIDDEFSGAGRSPERRSAVPCPRASPRKQCRGKRARKPLGFERVGGGDPPGFDRFSQLSLNPARSRCWPPRVACRANGPERRP